MSSTHSLESTCTVLTCTSEEFERTYNDGGLNTDVLSDDLLINTIRNTGKFHDDLVTADSKYRLDKLLEGMLLYAPTSFGKRYVGIALHIVRGIGAEAVVNLAKAWMQRLFFRMMTMFHQASEVEHSGSRTPTLDETAGKIDNTAQSDQIAFRDELRIREDYHCAITHSYDSKRVDELVAQGRRNKIPRVPNLPKVPMIAAHIIPFLVNDFSDCHSSAILEAART